MENGGANRFYPTGLFDTCAGGVYSHNAGNFRHAGNRYSFAVYHCQTSISVLSDRYGFELFAYTQILWALTLVGIANAICRHTLFNNDLEFRNKPLARQNRSLEG